MKKKCIILAGPTAVGKTSLALRLASHFSTSIISADSRQCYKELSVGVAKPTDAELLRVPHYFINSHSVNETVTAATFENYALAFLNDIFKNRDIAIMTGGTGLYIKAFAEGLDPVPPSDTAVRASVMSLYESSGLEGLQQQMAELDPVFVAKGDMKNPHRLMRALEVVMTCGRSILEFHSDKKVQRDFDIIKIALMRPRDVLYDRINCRVDEMIENGLELEAVGLLPLRHLPALRTVGYSEMFDFFDGKISFDACVCLIKQNTRNYAKRQITWFRNQPGYILLEADEESNLDQILGMI